MKKLILITPDTFIEQQQEIIPQTFQWIDKLHIKIDGDFNNLILALQQLQQTITQADFDKLVIHINEKILSLNKSPHSKEIITEIQSKLHLLHQQFNIINFHFSEIFTDKYSHYLDSLIFHNFHISASIHHLQLKEFHNHFHYLMYGPVFTSISKINYHPSQPLSELNNDLHTINEHYGIPIIAVGGINIQNFSDAIYCGFSGIALRGYIWQSTNPIQTLSDFYKKWKTLIAQ